MYGPRAFCPTCKQDVLFIESGSASRCSVCGTEFRRSPPVVPQSNWVEGTVMTIGHVLLRIVLILGVLFLVGIAVLFASCAFH